MNSPMERIQQAAVRIRERSKLKEDPRIGVILGSGLGSLADQVTDPVAIPYADIPGFHPTAVVGHAGRVIVGKFQGVPTVFLQGRFHYYEGYTMEDVVLPTRVLGALGVKTIVLTNAAGGVNTRYRPGDLMIIEDHLNLVGANPLVGPNLADLGPRFPDMTEAYHRGGIRVLEECAAGLGIPVFKGVYGGLLGPTYETPAEIRMYRLLGADALGMSTVPETIAAVHQGTRVVGVSAITNLAAGMSTEKLTHDEVLQNSRLGAEKLQKLLARAIPALDRLPSEREGKAPA